MILIRNGKICILLEGLVHGFGRKFDIFSFFLFLLKIETKIDGNVLDRKQSYIDQKNDLFTKSKNWLPVKGLVHGFNRKLEIFPIFFLSK